MNELGKKEETRRGGFGYEIERDERTGLPTGELNIDRYNQAIPDNEGVYRVRFVRVSDSGEVLEERYEDILGNPTSRRNGSFGCIKDYNQERKLIRETYLGADGKPAPLSDCQAVYVEYGYDDEGRQVEEFYYNIDGKRTLDEDGVYGYLTEHLERSTIVTFVDAQRQPMENSAGFSSIERQLPSLSNSATP